MDTDQPANSLGIFVLTHLRVFDISLVDDSIQKLAKSWFCGVNAVLPTWASTGEENGEFLSETGHIACVVPVQLRTVTGELLIKKCEPEMLKAVACLL